LKLSAARVERWTWILIYGGLIVLCVGFAVQQQGSAAGAAVVLGGAIAVAAGVALILVRARMSHGAQHPHPTSTEPGGTP
jgi:uncharacterized membrane protein HdeD (DUF308 family)